jgi:hypothetical protein
VGSESEATGHSFRWVITYPCTTDTMCQMKNRERRRARSRENVLSFYGCFCHNHSDERASFYSVLNKINSRKRNVNKTSPEKELMDASCSCWLLL